MNLRVLLSVASIVALHSGGVYASCTELDAAEAQGLTVSHPYDLIQLCLPDPRDARYKYTWASSDNLQVDLVLHPNSGELRRYIFVAIKPVASTFRESRAGRIAFNAYASTGDERGALKHYSIDVHFRPTPVHAAPAPDQQPVAPDSPTLWQPQQSNNRVILGSSNPPTLWEPPVMAVPTVSDRIDTHPPSLWAPGSETSDSPGLWSPTVASRARMITQLFEASTEAPPSDTTPAIWQPEDRTSPKRSRPASPNSANSEKPQDLWQP